jgi:hypothetical protein
MFRHRNRPAGFINWTDYRWEPSPWQGATEPRPWTGRAASPRRYSFLQVFLAGLAVVAGMQLLSVLKNSALRNRGNRSRLERGVLALLFLLVASYVSKQRRR